MERWEMRAGFSPIAELPAFLEQFDSTSVLPSDLPLARMMRVYQLDPVKDARWSEFTTRHACASVFHSVGWLEALRSTYAYRPVVFTTSSPSDELSNGLLFCRVDSWITGSRLVSLPFSDHCEPLCDSKDDLAFLLRYLQTCMEHENLRYLEVRPVNGNFAQASDTNGFRPVSQYYLHILDLRREQQELFESFDRDSVQRRIQRAERAGLIERCGQSEGLLRDFYQLFVKTRGRHGFPPSPYGWFRNLVQYSGEAVEIRVAYRDETPIAAVLILRCKNTVYYKYGCSDTQFHMFGAMPWLMWKAIAAAKLSGASHFDFGRTEEENVGLLAFKNHWVSQPQRLVYWRFPEADFLGSANAWKLDLAKRVFSLMPSRLRTAAGSIMYRHIG
jgi:hypothetical protein